MKLITYISLLSFHREFTLIRQQLAFSQLAFYPTRHDYGNTYCVPKLHTQGVIKSQDTCFGSLHTNTRFAALSLCRTFSTWIRWTQKKNSTSTILFMKPLLLHNQSASSVMAQKACSEICNVTTCVQSGASILVTVLYWLHHRSFTYRHSPYHSWIQQAGVTLHRVTWYNPKLNRRH